MGIFTPISAIVASAIRNGSIVTITTQVTLGNDAAVNQVINLSLNDPSGAAWTHTITQAEKDAGSLTDVHNGSIVAGNYTETATVTSGGNTATRTTSVSVP